MTPPGTQFTCYTSTKVQALTPQALCALPGTHNSMGPPPIYPPPHPGSGRATDRVEKLGDLHREALRLAQNLAVPADASAAPMQAATGTAGAQALQHSLQHSLQQAAAGAAGAEAQLHSPALSAAQRSPTALEPTPTSPTRAARGAPIAGAARSSDMIKFDDAMFGL